jgi:sn-glycerol 3-phosphate transport system permease protein
MKSTSIKVSPSMVRAAFFVLAIGTIFMIAPVYVAIVGSTHPLSTLATRTPGWFGDQGFFNYFTVAVKGLFGVTVSTMVFNSLVMALGIAVGKIAMSFLAAFAFVYFRFPGRGLCFGGVLLTLMLPVEVRIFPTFQVVSNLGLLNSYAGLIVPLTASATAIFLFRQFFMTVPDELMEASQIDGAGPMRFMIDILLPLSRTNIAALFVIMFLFGWNQFLWPLLITTDEGLFTIVMGLSRGINSGEPPPEWNFILPMVVAAITPPLILILVMQKQFIKGLIESEK